jgi:carbonic anhydrase
MFFRTRAIACSFALAGGLLLALPQGASATVWQPVHTTAKSQTEIDLDSITKKDGASTAWMQVVHADPVASKSGAYFIFRTMKMQARFSCAQRNVTIVGRAYYNDTGAEVASERQPEDARNVAPETPDDRAMSIACAADPKKTAAAMRKPEITQARYMDGPIPAGARPGLIKASADAHDAHTAPAAPAAKPAADAHGAPAAADPPKPKVALPPLPLSGPGAPVATAAPAAHGAGAAHVATAPADPAAHGHAAPAPARVASVPVRESREKVVERVLRDRGIARPAVVGAAATVGHEEAHWDYEGENAPYRWGDMKADFATCKSGQRQSPIDIRNAVVSDLEPIVFHYEESPLKVLNNGHTIQVEFAPGSFILHGGARYELLQMHFHTPSEERINGRGFDMVAHLVHKSAQGKLAVVAVLLTAGKTHPVIETIWNTMPGTAGRTRERPEVAFNPMSIMPTDRNFYSFQGSLTTPPCTEGVQWLVMKTPVELGREQVSHFGALYPMNARPIQPVNDRVIKAGR